MAPSISSSSTLNPLPRRGGLFYFKPVAPAEKLKETFAWERRTIVRSQNLRIIVLVRISTGRHVNAGRNFLAEVTLPAKIALSHDNRSGIEPAVQPI
jgi:hypothetical protein